MPATIATIVIGIICVILGINNMRGNISSLHSYHRKRVAEEDILPFGRLVGLGTIIVGAGIILFGILSAIGMWLGNEIFTLCGTAVMIVAMVVGLAVSFYAMKKYNKGIF